MGIRFASLAVSAPIQMRDTISPSHPLQVRAKRPKPVAPFRLTPRRFVINFFSKKLMAYKPKAGAKVKLKNMSLAENTGACMGNEPELSLVLRGVAMLNYGMV